MKVKFIKKIGTYRLGQIIETDETHAAFLIAKKYAVSIDDADAFTVPKKKYKKGES